MRRRLIAQQDGWPPSTVRSLVCRFAVRKFLFVVRLATLLLAGTLLLLLFFK